MVGAVATAWAVLALGAADAGALSVPWSRDTFKANEGCVWAPEQDQMGFPRMNAHYIAPPERGADWQGWLESLHRYRQFVREHMGDASVWRIDLDFDGVRAWIRLDEGWSRALALAPGETTALTGQARWRGGNSRLCAAFDLWARGKGRPDYWSGWSGVVASTPVATDGEWHPFRLEVRLPAFDPEAIWARPIFGMDGTFDATRGSLSLKGLALEVPETEGRARLAGRRGSGAPGAEGRTSQGLQTPAEGQTPFGLYDRPDLAWGTRNFVCGFVFMYDRSFWDPESGRYEVDRLLQDARREFGGYDSVVLWQAYPRIGADDRNQFDFFRDMPGGLVGLRRAVDRFHQSGVRVFIPYNPWDQGTAREAVSDDEALARMVAALGADGIFLDTMVEAPTGLRTAVDAARPGVAFEPEGHPTVEELDRCSSSWAQGLEAFPGIGALRLKWIEPRHMQHQIRRWDTSHAGELAAAWLNGSGMLVWENVFGTWNPWGPADRATLRRMAPVLRAFADVLSAGEWLPAYPTLTASVHGSCWQRNGVRLWTLMNEGAAGEVEVLKPELGGARWYDLWRGVEVTPRDGRIAVPLDRLGAILALEPGAAVPGLQELLRAQQLRARRDAAPPATDTHMAALPVVEAKPVPLVAPRSTAPAGMVRVGDGEHLFHVEHMRRECGCFPDPGTPEAGWGDFLRGYPHDETMAHNATVTTGELWVSPRVVTKGEFAAFLAATGYVPACADHFLADWDDRTCPPGREAEPLVYVDLADARAYAAWAGARLPTEWEWQAAAEVLGDAFARGEVWEWTESERDDGHTRFVMLRGGSRYRAEGSAWYFPGGVQPIGTHAKFLLMHPGLDRCAAIGFRCVVPAG